MCSRVLATIFIIYCLNSGFCEDLIDISCKINTDCNIFTRPGQNATCLDSKCSCQDINGNQIDCDPQDDSINNLVGGKCPCNMNHSRCDTINNHCLCETDYKPSQDKRRCIKNKILLGDQCEDDAQCISNVRFSACDLVHHICTCQPRHVEHDNSCISLVALDHHCKNTTQCVSHTPDSVCLTGKCACKTGYIAKPDHSACLIGADLNENCTHSVQCHLILGPGSECYSGMCTCDVNHYELLLSEAPTKSVICERHVAIGDTCREHHECYHFLQPENEQSMQCHLNECICREGFKQKNKFCISNGASAGAIYSKILLFSPFIALLCRSFMNS